MDNIDWEQHSIDFARLPWKDKSICFWWSLLRKERLNEVMELYAKGMPLKKAINKIRNNE